MGGVLGVDGVMQDRPRQPVGSIEVLVREQEEGCVAARDIAARRGNPVREIDEVRRAVHDDKTPERAGTFTLRPAYASGASR